MLIPRNKVVFEQLLDGPVAMLYDYYGQKVIIFPQNFEAVPGMSYDCLDVELTLTGMFVYKSKNYRVARAYHPNFTRTGDPRDKSASVIEQIEVIAKSRLNKLGESPFASLSGIKDSLPILEQKIRIGIQDTPRMKVGSKILRPLAFYNTGKVKDAGKDLSFTKTDQGSFLIKASAPSFIVPTTHWVVVPESSTRKPFVCFCSDPISSNWIYFVVVGMNPKGTVAFVKPRSGAMEELLREYDTQLIDSERLPENITFTF